MHQNGLASTVAFQGLFGQRNLSLFSIQVKWSQDCPSLSFWFTPGMAAALQEDSQNYSLYFGQEPEQFGSRTYTLGYSVVLPSPDWRVLSWKDGVSGCLFKRTVLSQKQSSPSFRFSDLFEQEPSMKILDVLVLGQLCCLIVIRFLFFRCRPFKKCRW